MMMKAAKLDLAGPGKKQDRSRPGAKQEQSSSRSRAGAEVGAGKEQDV